MSKAFAQLAFTPSVRALQTHDGSAEAYDRVRNADVDSGYRLTAREAAFLQARDGFVQATIGETGWPYVQFRGGYPGFLNVLDPQTLGYADYPGNRQHISAGNLSQNNRVSILAIDYATRQRLKLLGRATLSDDPAAIAALSIEGQPPTDRAVIIHVEAFDWNCPKHIPMRLTDAEYGGEIKRLRAEIQKLKAHSD